MRETAIGNKHNWELISRISEGDAGEIYRVKAVDNNSPAILKRPTQNPFDAARQLKQIRLEGEILSAFREYYSFDTRKIKTHTILPVEFLDQGGNERFFIVMKSATGFSLKKLEEVSKNGMPTNELLSHSQIEQHFINQIIKNKKVPRYLILKVLKDLLFFFDEIHSLENLGSNRKGIIWNDVKPDHIFWDPKCSQITIIDWGNSQFLNHNGVAEDGNLDVNADFFQYLDAIGRYVKIVCPELAEQLEWPISVNIHSTQKDFFSLKKRILFEFQNCERRRKELRDREELIYSQPSNNRLEDLQEIHDEILNFGEYPDYDKSGKYNSILISQLAKEQDFEGCRAILHSETFFYEDSQQYQIVDELISSVIPQKSIYFSKAIQEAVSFNSQDWEEVFWNIHYAFMDADGAFKTNKKLLSSLSAKLNKQIESALYNQLINLRHRLEKWDRRKRNRDEILALLEKLDEILEDWNIQEARAGKLVSFKIGYENVREIVASLLLFGDDSLIENVREIQSQLLDPERCISVVKSAWESHDFHKARKELRTLHKWDPERLRVFTADRLLARASIWVSEASINKWNSNKAIVKERLNEGKKFRYFFGEANWLDEEIKYLEGNSIKNKSNNRNDKASKEKVRQLRKQEKLVSGHVLDNNELGIIQVDKNANKNSFQSVSPEEGHQDFWESLRTRDWKTAKACLSIISGNTERENYLVIEEALEKMSDFCQLYAIQWTDLIDVLERNNSRISSKEISNVLAVIEWLQKKDWKNAKIASSVYYKKVVDESLEIIRKISEKNWYDKISYIDQIQHQASVLNKNIPQTTIELVLYPYLLSIMDNTTKFCKNMENAKNVYKNSLNEASAYKFLLSIHDLESYFSNNPQKINFWITEYQHIVKDGKNIEIDRENPTFVFLKAKRSQSNSFARNFSGVAIAAGWVVTIAVVGCALFSIVSNEFGFSLRKTLFPHAKVLSSLTPIPSMIPFVAINTSTAVPPPLPTITPAEAPTTLPTITLSLVAPQSSLGCEDAKKYVENQAWTEYLTVLKGVSEAQYESIRQECGWIDTFSQRKLDVNLRYIQSIPSERRPEEKLKLAQYVKQLGWRQTAAYIDQLRAEDSLPGFQTISWALGMCNSTTITVPEDIKNILVNEINQIYADPALKQVFGEICQQDLEVFLGSKIISGDWAIPGTNLLSYAPPYDDSTKPCFYSDEDSQKKNYHYKGTTKDCRLPLSPASNEKMYFVEFEMCLINPPRFSTFEYGMQLFQGSINHVFLLTSKDGQSFPYIENSPFGIKDKGVFSTSQITCGQGELNVQAIVLGNLLFWNYKSGNTVTDIAPQALSDEFGIGPLDISLFGYVQSEAAQELHFIINKFEIRHGVTP